MITIDFETRSEVDLKKRGAWNYAMHPTTEVLCMAYKIGDGDVQLWTPGQPYPQDFKDAIISDERLEAHNAMFEKYIWRFTMRKHLQYEWVPIPDDRWQCSAAKAAAHALPRDLDGATEALGLAEKKDNEGHKLMLKMASPRKITKKNKEKWHDDPVDHIKLGLYCMQDVRAEHGLSERLRDLRPEERAIWLLDQKINTRGINLDLESVHAAIRLSEEYQEKINKDLPGLTDGVITKATQRQRIVDFCQREGLSHVESLSKDSVEEYLKDPFMAEGVRKVLEIRLLLAKSSVAKYKKMILAACSDGRVRDLLMYHGAGTGRWTGKGIQPHNFPKRRYKGDLDSFHDFLKTCTLDQFEMVFDKVMETLSSTIRSFLIPTEGKHFFGGDFAAIEARVVAWCAGDEDALDDFRSGLDMYKIVAALRYKTTYEEVTDDQRALGKVIILACGFQMGWHRFQETCEEWGLGVVSDDDSKDAVNFYRNKYPKVVQLWKDQEESAKMAVTHPDRLFKCGKVAWMVHEGFLHCRLPSGRLLSYYDPIMKVKRNETREGKVWYKETISYMSMDSTINKFVRTYTYGGKLVENFVQAIARDLMANGMENCEAAGYDVVLSVHDELISENDPKVGTIKEFERLMCKRPEWIGNCPIDVEGWTGTRYLK